jgi:hypothetical protein
MPDDGKRRAVFASDYGQKLVLHLFPFLDFFTGVYRIVEGEARLRYQFPRLETVKLYPGIGPGLFLIGNIKGVLPGPDKKALSPPPRW